jgi:hypothetical protein
MSCTGGLIHYPTGFFLRQSQLPPQLVKMLFAQFQQLPLDDRYSQNPAPNGFSVQYPKHNGESSTLNIPLVSSTFASVHKTFGLSLVIDIAIPVMTMQRELPTVFWN